METILVVLHVIVAVVIVGLVLLQRSEGGGLGLGGGSGGGGMGGFMSARGTANLLTRATAVAAALFFATSMALSILVSDRGEPVSIVDDMGTQTEAPAAEPEAPVEESEPSVPLAE